MGNVTLIISSFVYIKAEKKETRKGEGLKTYLINKEIVMNV